jgi:SIR2-like protein
MDSPLLFLGAGASKPFGIGELKDITAKVEKAIIEKGYADILRNIHETLIEGNDDSTYFANEDEIDIEVILSVLHLLTQPSSALKNLGPAGIYLNRLAKKVKSSYSLKTQPREAYVKARKIVEDEIVESCNGCDFKRAHEYYQRLFILETSVTPSYRNALDQEPRIPLFSHVVTTNYDLVLERYDKESISPAKHLLCRGFTRGGYDWNEPYLDINEVNTAALSKLTYLKLHGSIDWWVRDSDNKVVIRESPTSLMGESYQRRQMIYPVYDKHVSENPYSYLYNCFRALLNRCEVYIVVGYSFRDPSINNAFRDCLQYKRESRMIIVNTNPDNLRSRIQTFPNAKLDVITAPFGSNELINHLENTVNQMPKGYGS